MSLPKRKTNRLRLYDYSQNGAYFITICVKDRKKLLGEIVGGGVLDAPRIVLSKYGMIAGKYLNSINNFYENISINTYSIMPNHIHMILVLNNTGNGTSGTPSPTMQLFRR